MDSKENTHGSPPGKLKGFGEKTSFGRPGQPVELAPLYVSLASDVMHRRNIWCHRRNKDCITIPG
jgi:hypothetical protein